MSADHPHGAGSAPPMLPMQQHGPSHVLVPPTGGYQQGPYQQHQQPVIGHPLHMPQGQPQQLPQPDPSAMKLTRGTSCVLCQQRKVRCDKNKPCANCVKAGVECRVIPPQPPRRRKKRLQEKDLVDRLKKYETLLSEHGVKFDSISHELRSDGPHLDDVDELENDFEALKTTPEVSVSPSGGSEKERSGGAWNSLHREFRASEQLLHDSDDDEPGQSLIHRAFDKIYSNNHDGFPFVVGGRAMSITDEHPSTIHILQIWQLYIDNINPLLKITHIPTVQPQIIMATSQLHNAPKSIEALMFSIYAIVINSLEDADVQQKFGENKREAVGRYLVATQQAFINANFMRMCDAITLQAFMLYLFTIRWYVDPRQVYCQIGIAVRIAQRMGLHRDPAGWGLPPFEVEQRRRLWWLLVGYDRRIGEITGSTVTALSTGCDCKMPLNVNDSDLHIEGKELPKPHVGPTEMLFALTRVELAMAVASNSNRDSFKVNNPEKDKGSPSSAGQPAKPVPHIRIAGQDGPGYTLDGFCAHIEGTYLTQCDPKIPLHFFTLTITRQLLCKMRVIGFLVRMHDSEAMPLKDIERDNLVAGAIQMIEYDNVVQSSDSLKPFKWYAMHHFPFPAYMFLVNELRQRCTGHLVERAWDAISANYDLRGLLNDLHSPMHSAFSSQFIKAWDARASAMAEMGKQADEPRFLSVLRARQEERRKARQARASDSQHSGPPNSQDSNPRRGQGQVMTPPMDAALAFSGRVIPSTGAPPSSDENMDWSYLYQDGQNFQGPMASFGFGGPMGGGMGPMGGMGGPMGPGMGGGMGGGNMFGS